MLKCVCVCVLFIPVSLALDNFGDIPALYQHLGNGVRSRYWCDFSVSSSCDLNDCSERVSSTSLSGLNEVSTEGFMDLFTIVYLSLLLYSMPQVEISGGLFYAANLGLVDITKNLLAKYKADALVEEA